MRGKTLLILVAVTLALGGFIAFYEKDLPSTDERQELRKKLIEVADLEEKLEAIEMREGDSIVRLEKSEDASWRLTKPFDARADMALVTGLTSKLASLEKTRSLGDLDRAEAGLKPPRASLTLTLDRERELILEIGEEVPGSSDFLVAEAGTPQIHQTSNVFWEDFERSPGDWRDKALFPHSRDAVERLYLSDANKEVVLVRRGEDFWVEDPLVDLADRTAIGSLMNTLTGLSAVRFLEEMSAGEFTPQMRLEVTIAGRPEPLLLEVDDAGGVARVDGQMVLIDSGLGESFFVDPQRWRSPAWTTLQVYKINEATARDAVGEVRLTRDGTDWMRDGEPIGYAAASDLLYALVEVRSEEIRDGSSGTFEADLAFDLAADETTAQLFFRSLPDGRAEVMSSQREAVLVLSAEDAQKVRDKMEALRDAEAGAASGDPES